jgi:hypothetical protein
MTEKIIGYLLISTGLIIMVMSGFNVYSVFTKQTKPVQFFSFSGIGINPSQLVGGQTPVQFQAQAGQAKSVEIISPEMINDTSNLFAHVFLMGFIVSLGYKIASLGVKLVRPVVVKLRGVNEPSNKV